MSIPICTVGDDTPLPRRDIPDFLAHLPVFRGYPVPYFVPEDIEGNYLLKYASGEKMMNCFKYHKCCICFKPLIKNSYWFISGPMGLTTQMDSHSPMHEYCAEYSLQVCPHIFYEKTRRTTDGSDTPSYSIREKPANLFLIRAEKFGKIKHPEGLVFYYKKFVVKKKFGYERGTLTEID